MIAEIVKLICTIIWGRILFDEIKVEKKICKNWLIDWFVFRVNVKLPSVEVRYKNLNVEAECEVVQGKPLPTLWNSFSSLFSDLVKTISCSSQETKLGILKDVSGIIKPARLTLLLGPPSCGKTTLLMALAGKLDQSLEPPTDMPVPTIMVTCSKHVWINADIFAIYYCEAHTLSERLVSSLSTQGTYIVREGDPVTEMLFIIRGKLESSTTNGGRTGFFNSITLRPGDFCGEELLAWALLPKSTLNLPSSTRTVKALVEFEAFELRAEDLKFVANQFRRLHSKKLQHTFRFYSYHWRTWAACFIQVAWRRFKKRVLANSLSLREYKSFIDEQARNRMEHEKEERGNTAQVKQNLGVTILASRFAANTRKGVQKIKDVEMLKLQKPEEPDFSVEHEDD
ncbi:cyclic nucleotide-gated ion channel 17 [Lathyrus oleraceus]|uniref:cyclic nucleotide-gated ion channel 17 n=1 Tax=Pisum sativum TaxID=3888 RepID=UPI0021D1438E|nr:cyclic nucleotide-gated ion channel 17-like [Pisum sativum]